MASKWQEFHAHGTKLLAKSSITAYDSICAFIPCRRAGDPYDAQDDRHSGPGPSARGRLCTQARNASNTAIMG